MWAEKPARRNLHKPPFIFRINYATPLISSGKGLNCVPYQGGIGSELTINPSPHGKTQSSSIGVRNRTTKVPVKDYSAATVPITDWLSICMRSGNFWQYLNYLSKSTTSESTTSRFLLFSQHYSTTTTTTTTHTHTHTHTHRERERKTHTQRKRQTERMRQREIERDFLLPLPTPFCFPIPSSPFFFPILFLLFPISLL